MFQPDRRHHLRSLGACALALAALPSGAADAFPAKPVTLVVPNVPGGAIDLLARLLERQLGERWGQPVLVVYKPGAGTVLGTDFVAKSAPDGYTLGLVVTSHVINPALRPNMPFDTLKDLTGITQLARSPIALSARPGLPAKNLQQLIDHARRNPGTLSYASPGSGSAMHLAAERLKTLAGIDLLHTPYKGSGGAYQDVFGERVDLIFDPLFSSLQHIRSGRMKALAIIGAQRSPIAPDLPTAAETLPGFVVDSIFGLVAPAATPAPVLQRIHSDVVQVLQTDTVRARMTDIGLTPVGNTATEFNAYIRADIVRWAAVVKQANITLD